MSAPRGRPPRGRPPLPPGPYLIVGLARSGAAAGRILASRGEVIGCDRAARAEALEIAGVEVHLGSEGVELLDRVRTVVKSPGVPSSAAVIAAAHERGLEVVGELELAWRLISNDFVAITGTNGKTTTTELIAAIHREAGISVAVAGNVGTPLSSLAGEIGEQAVVICEVSSFQLDDASAFAPECAVLVNLAEDHLDRHGSADRYRQAKLQIFANQRPDDLAVLPADLAELLADPAMPRVITFGGKRADLQLRPGGPRSRGGALWWADELLMPVADIRLRGAHNIENAMAAAAAALARGLETGAITGALATFAGVRHRLEEIAERAGVLFVNDSKATNVASAAAAIEAFSGGVHAILGGSLKGGGFAGLRAAVEARCRGCYLIGAAADTLAEDLHGTVALNRCGDLERALAAATAAARPGEVVLLSPACASFDQYTDFEARGEHFRALVEHDCERSRRTTRE